METLSYGVSSVSKVRKSVCTFTNIACTFTIVRALFQIVRAFFTIVRALLQILRALNKKYIHIGTFETNGTAYCPLYSAVGHKTHVFNINH